MDMILILYVDDLLLLGEDLSKIQDLKHQLGKLYQMKDLGQPPARPEPQPWYSLHPTKEWQAHQPQPSGDNINTILVNMFKEGPNSYQEALKLEESDKWLAASQEEFDGLTEMGVWKLVGW